MRFPALLISIVIAATAVRFEPVQPDVLSTGGTFVNAWADFNGDSTPDLFVGFNGAPNRLYRNTSGVLSDVATEMGLADNRPTRAAAWGDYDADGDPDLFLGFAPPGDSVLKLYRNDRGRFTNVSEVLGITSNTAAVRQPAWIDFDFDGDLDLFIAFRDRANALLRNDGGKFTDVAPEVGLADARKSVGAVWFDFDADGDLDVYVGNMDGDSNALFRNDRGRFTDVAPEANVDWGGRKPKDPANGTVRPCAADVDADGQFDLFMANYGPNGLFLNRRGTFEDVSAARGIAIDARYDTCAFADFDNDGALDLYVNGTVTGGTSYRDYLFRNAGERFEDVTPDNLKAIQSDHGALWIDFDSDGDADLSLTGMLPEGMHSVLRNTLPAADAGRSLRVSVLDAKGHATRAGAEVRLFEAGTRRLLGSRLVDTGSGYDSQSEIPVHFGLAKVSRVDVHVVFPGNGELIETWERNVDPRRLRGRVLIVRMSR